MSNSHSDAYQLGRESAKSFLTAGERYLKSGRPVRGTDEERFKNFFNDLSGDKQGLLRKYFLKQAALSPPERKRILGNYANLARGVKLDLSTSAKFIQTGDSAENKMEVIERTISTAFLLSQRPILTAPSTPVYNEVSLYLNRFSVIDDEDNDGGDEVTLITIRTDVTGKISKVSKNLGSVKKFRNQNDIVRNVKLTSIRIDEGGDVFPKAVHFKVLGIERDSGSEKWNDLLDDLIKIAQDKVDEELIARGLVAGGVSIGVSIPPEVALIIASFVEGFIDDLIANIGELLKDYDDEMGHYSMKVSLRRRPSCGHSGMSLPLCDLLINGN